MDYGDLKDGDLFIVGGCWNYLKLKVREGCWDNYEGLFYSDEEMRGIEVYRVDWEEYSRYRGFVGNEMEIFYNQINKEYQLWMLKV